jgi:hypothetical protein
MPSRCFKQIFLIRAPNFFSANLRGGHVPQRPIGSDATLPGTTVDELLKILQPMHPRLPLTSRSLLQTNTATVETKTIGSGKYMHFGLLKAILHHKEHVMKHENSDIKYQVNIDGLPVYKSSSIQLWPIIARIINSNCMFIIGSFRGTAKPSCVEDFLQQFVDEARALASDGFTVDGRKYTANVICFICDAPARAYIKQIKTHTGYYACERCTEKGDYIGGKVAYQSTDASKRTDEDFSLMKYEGHQLNRSPLLELNVGLVSGCVLDSMHLVHLGVARRLLNYWIRGPKAVRLSAVQVGVISAKLVSLRQYIPCEFMRKPRPLQEINKWKASDMRQFLLYTGLSVLKHELEDKYYTNFLNLSAAVFMLSSPALLEHYSDYCGSLLKYFVNECSKLYGPEFIVYNVHSLVHIADDAKKYGCLENISSFPFENFLGQLKKSVRKPQQILQQIFNRLSHGYCVTKCSERQATTVKREHDSGPVVLGLRHMKQYKEVHTADFVLKLHVPDNCIRLTNGKISLIRNIFCDGITTSLVIQKFKKLTPVYTTPLLSTDIGICFLSDLGDALEICQLADTCSKMVMLPDNADSNSSHSCR